MRDGVDMNDAIDNLIPYQPSPDAVEQVRVETNSFVEPAQSTRLSEASLPRKAEFLPEKPRQVNDARFAMNLVQAATKP
jgi:hypothetical protein